MTDPHDEARNEPQPGELKTTVGRRWALKTIIFAVVLLGLGVWGGLDAFWIYPERGRAHIRFAERDYLLALDEQYALRATEASVIDPAETLAELRSADGDRSNVQLAREVWLTAVSRLHPLSGIAEQNADILGEQPAPDESWDASPTMFVNPRQHLRDLEAELANVQQPKPLTAYDLPLQYVFLIGGLAGGVALLGFYGRVATRVYRYDPQARRLTMPGGDTFTAEQIEMLDKRKWDKFLVFVTLAGREGEIRLDLYRHQPLEEWIIDMWRHSPSYEPDDDETAKTQPDQANDDEPQPTPGTPGTPGNPGNPTG